MTWYIANEILRASLTLIISFSTSASEIIVLLRTPQNIAKYFQLHFVKTTGMLQCKEKPPI